MDRIIRPLFWDVEEKEIDFDAHAFYVIERVLEHGNDGQVRWLFEHYAAAEIRRVIETSRRLSPRSENYWRVKFNIWSQSPLVPRRSAIWKY